jgi:hypothetical protein
MRVLHYPASACEHVTVTAAVHILSEANRFQRLDYPAHVANCSIVSRLA